MCFNGQCRYKYLVLGRDTSYFVPRKNKNKKTKNKTTMILPKSSLKKWNHQNARVFNWQHFFYLVDVFFNRQSALQLTPTVLLFTPNWFLFFSLYEEDFILGLLEKNWNKLARSLNFTFLYIDDVLSLNNSKLLLILLTASIPLSLQ
jgi:hypothetical protein